MKHEIELGKAASFGICVSPFVSYTLERYGYIHTLEDGADFTPLLAS